MSIRIISHKGSDYEAHYEMVYCPPSSPGGLGLNVEATVRALYDADGQDVWPHISSGDAHVIQKAIMQED